MPICFFNAEKVQSTFVLLSAVSVADSVGGFHFIIYKHLQFLVNVLGSPFLCVF